tara:strand:- start:68 stop:172 length:105 start_codon:yes stop_codon:yes gene_type:complete
MIKNKSQNLWKEIKPFFKEVGKNLTVELFTLKDV